MPRAAATNSSIAARLSARAVSISVMAAQILALITLRFARSRRRGAARALLFRDRLDHQFAALTRIERDVGTRDRGLDQGADRRLVQIPRRCQLDMAHDVAAA